MAVEKGLITKGILAPHPPHLSPGSPDAPLHPHRFRFPGFIQTLHPLMRSISTSIFD